MNFLFETLCSAITTISEGASLRCAMFFFEPEVPKSLREE